MPSRTRTLAKHNAPLATIPVDPKLDALWRKLSSAIRAAIARDASAFDERWELSARIVNHDPPLYVFGGHKTPADFFRTFLHENPRNAQRFMRVAKYASPKEEAKFGITLLDAAIGYLEAKQGKPLGKSLPTSFDRLRVTVTRNGKKREVLLGDATAEEVAEATKALLKAAGKTRAKPKGHAETALTKLFANAAPVASVRIRERGGIVDILGVPVGAWESFKRVIASATLETLVGDEAPAKPRKQAKKKAR